MRKIDSLNLVPFIDIVLVLLVIVLTTASFINQSRINIDIPKVDSVQSQRTKVEKNDRVISIKKSGEFYFEDKALNLAELEVVISRLPKESDIVINGDRESNFDSFVLLMDMLQRLGFGNLFVLVDEKKEG